MIWHACGKFVFFFYVFGVFVCFLVEVRGVGGRGRLKDGEEMVVFSSTNFCLPVIPVCFPSFSLSRSISSGFYHLSCCSVGGGERTDSPFSLFFFLISVSSILVPSFPYARVPTGTRGSSLT